ncbi:MAG: hypothetical protein AAFX99_17755 [Myxococcota bacterium]
MWPQPKPKGYSPPPEAFDFWSDQSTIDAHYTSDASRYNQAYQTIVEGMSDNVELNRALMRYETMEPFYGTTPFHIDGL